MVKEHVRLSEKLLLMHTFVQTTVDDVNRTKVKAKMKKQMIKVLHL